MTTAQDSEWPADGHNLHAMKHLPTLVTTSRSRYARPCVCMSGWRERRIVGRDDSVHHTSTHIHTTEKDPAHTAAGTEIGLRSDRGWLPVIISASVPRLFGRRALCARARQTDLT